MGRPQTTRRILSGSRSINAGWVQGPAPTDSDQDSYRGERAYLGKGLWSRRLTEPALQPADLLPLDAVVLSHLHGDHFDRIARRELDHTVPLVTTEQTAGRLSKYGFAAHGLPVWETYRLAARSR